MGKIIYSNIFASSIHYPVIDYLLNIKEFYEEGDTLMLCFWDFEIYTFKVFNKTISVREITREISKLLNTLKIKHKIIYLSDAIKRINNNPELFELLLISYTYISMGKIEDTYKNNKYLKLRPTTLGKLNFMVIDYIIALFFKDLYPNLAQNKSVDIYHTGERFLGIKQSIQESISKNELVVNFPLTKYWKALPILNYSKGEWISASMSMNEIENIIRENFPKDKESLKDLILIGNKIKDSSLNFKIENLIKEMGEKDLSDEYLISEIAKILDLYFYKIKSLINESEESVDIKKITYVNTKKEFENIFENINSAKLEILKECNGRNTIEDIIKKISMKESSVRSYISRMKKEGLISNSKNPSRLIDEIIVNFE